MTYRERRLAKADRLRGWSGKRRAKSDASFESARRVADGIPLGQPILVGHHSGRRHRRDLDRIDSGMRNGVEHHQKAVEMSNRADEIERQADAAIYSDDPDAVEQLRKRLVELERERDNRKTANAEYRKAHRADLATMTPYQRSQAVPYPSYSLSNLSGNIARTRARLEQLSGHGQRRPVITETSTATARAGLIVTAGMTTPTKPGKTPRPVWTVTGNLAEWRQMLLGLDGRWYRGAVSFFDDPTTAIERACAESETPLGNIERALEQQQTYAGNYCVAGQHELCGGVICGCACHQESTR